MRSNRKLLLTFIVMECSVVWAQPVRRLAIVPMNGALAQANVFFAFAEGQIADGVTAKLTGQPGLVVIDRGSIDKVLKEQNFQNSDRSSSDAAVRIGKILGVGQIALVNVYGLSYTTNPNKEGRSTRTMGTIVVRVNVRMIEVETGVILAEPSSAFQDSALISEISQGYRPGTIKVKSSNDPKVISDNEWAKASEAVTNDLAAKLTTAVASAPKPKTALALVAGISDGSVFINQVATAGIAKGNKLQVVREVSVGLNDPQTGKPLMQKKRICVLTIVDVEERNASGACEGGLPQKEDVAEPMQP
jgi:hypothetical protein